MTILSMLFQVGHLFIYLFIYLFPLCITSIIKLFDKNNVEISYSCTPNMKNVIQTNANLLLK